MAIWADALPLRQKALKVYIPRRSIAPYYSFVRIKTQAREIDPVAGCDLSAGWQRVETPQEADAAAVFITSPFGRNGYEFDMLSGEQRPDAGYIPISLQYRPYTAILARRESIAGGDPREASANRSYQGKTEYTANESDLDLVLQTKAAMGAKPLIVVIRMDKPAVMGEFEPAADAILADFGVSRQAIFDVLTGKAPCPRQIACPPARRYGNGGNALRGQDRRYHALYRFLRQYLSHRLRAGLIFGLSAYAGHAN